MLTFILSMGLYQTCEDSSDLTDAGQAACEDKWFIYSLCLCAEVKVMLIVTSAFSVHFLHFVPPLTQSTTSTYNMLAQKVVCGQFILKKQRGTAKLLI